MADIELIFMNVITDRLYIFIRNFIIYITSVFIHNNKYIIYVCILNFNVNTYVTDDNTLIYIHVLCILQPTRLRVQLERQNRTQWRLHVLTSIITPRSAYHYITYIRI